MNNRLGPIIETLPAGYTLDGRPVLAEVRHVPHRIPFGRRIQVFVQHPAGPPVFDTLDHVNGGNAFAALREWVTAEITAGRMTAFAPAESTALDATPHAGPHGRRSGSANAEGDRRELIAAAFVFRN